MCEAYLPDDDNEMVMTVRFFFLAKKHWVFHMCQVLAQALYVDFLMTLAEGSVVTCILQIKKLRLPDVM